MKEQCVYFSVFWKLFPTGKTLFLFAFMDCVLFPRITYVPAEHLEEFRISLGPQSEGIVALDIFSSYTGR
jgi:hypothetical protein